MRLPQDAHDRFVPLLPNCINQIGFNNFRILSYERCVLSKEISEHQGRRNDNRVVNIESGGKAVYNSFIKRVYVAFGCIYEIVDIG